MGKLIPNMIPSTTCRKLSFTTKNPRDPRLQPRAGLTYGQQWQLPWATTTNVKNILTYDFLNNSKLKLICNRLRTSMVKQGWIHLHLCQSSKMRCKTLRSNLITNFANTKGAFTTLVAPGPPRLLIRACFSLLSLLGDLAMASTTYCEYLLLNTWVLPRS